ncbi:hypothetical protein AURDEDRAFT_113688 [Auricularia subglabra TFB-10046 SS5]|nr:hypothetical protein AURDEDRAFT_113688 [Auricularia subglabra TFB-10046 SS5]
MPAARPHSFLLGTHVALHLLVGQHRLLFIPFDFASDSPVCPRSAFGRPTPASAPPSALPADLPASIGHPVVVPKLCSCLRLSLSTPGGPPPLDLDMWLCKSCQNAVFLACFAQPPPLALASTRSSPPLRLLTSKLHCSVISAPRWCIHGPCQDSGRVFGFREGVFWFWFCSSCLCLSFLFVFFFLPTLASAPSLLEGGCQTLCLVRA